MRAKFSDDVLNSSAGAEMTSILRACVHCGFCNATCPTYQLQGDELDGPRGRIYLIKSMLEGESTSADTQTHLDRCLTCRSCETTCPSGVRYSRLVELARPMVDEQVPRSWVQRLQRWLLLQVVPYPRRFGALMRLARWVKPLCPAALAEMIPPAPRSFETPRVDQQARRMLLLRGCAQAATSPATNAAAVDIFDTLGISLSTPPHSACCGALAYHLGEVEEARACARQNIDAFTAELDAGAEAIIATSSGCAVMLREYAELLADDPDYAPQALRIAELVEDPSAVLDPQELARHYRVSESHKIAFHSPCTLTHGLRQAAGPAACLRAVGFDLTEIEDAHLCCGSAGSYSLLQPALANQLLENKLSNLDASGAATFVSANIGCQMHLEKRSTRPVRHWLEMIRPHRTGP